MKNLSQQVGRLTIDLGAIKRNWQLLSDRSQCCVAAVVKANAYGLGVDRVAPALYSQGCRDFYVATLAEGVQLRKILSGAANIYLLAGIGEGDEIFCVVHQLIPVLSSLESVIFWAEFNAAQSSLSPSVIKFDSGMTRLGLIGAELTQLLSQPDLILNANAIIFMSHLACADQAYHSFNKEQWRSFERAGKQFLAVDSQIKLSLANSSGIFLGENYQFDQVRSGAALYGINPSPLVDNPMCAVVTLELPVLQVKPVMVDSSVGYGCDANIVKGSVLAVVQGGYADGLNRMMGSNPFGYVAGVEVPVVGRISMDSAVFNVTGIDNIVRGDFIQVMGGLCPQYKFSGGGEALGYEVLTSLGDRYQRVYLDGE
jgi:alanine racemase